MHNLLRFTHVGVAAHENPHLEIDPPYDDVEVDQTIDRACDFEEIVLSGYSVQKIAKDRLVGEETFTESIGGFDLAINSSRHRTFSSSILSIPLNPFLDHMQDGACLAHNSRVDRWGRNDCRIRDVDQRLIGPLDVSR
ncbi:hypothetical protein P5V15_009414 [Pogonomyrmex californicus]